MDYEGFKREIYAMSSINLSCYKEKQMKRRIDSLLSRNGFTAYEDFVKALQIDNNLYNDFINYLTINVSEFYRNPEQWEVLKKDIFPLLLQKNKRIRIWSAACSTGEEPYTLVMVLNHFLPLGEIKILATDIDKEALRKAQAGKYLDKSLEKLPSEYKTKYFTKQDGYYIVNGEVKNCVEFRHHNLLKDNYAGPFDLIVCRNVLIYFTEEAKDHVYREFNRALRDGGILFLGSTEQIIPPERYGFTPIITFFYSKK